MRHHVGYLLIMQLLVLGLLLWIGYARLLDFHQYHTFAARESSTIAADEILRFVEEKQRLVSLFRAMHQDLIQAVAREPADDVLFRRLADRVADYFPEHFTFTVLDAYGQPLVEDFDGLIGELCLSDVRAFLDSGRQSPRIHPHAEVYHFDVLAPLGEDGVQGVFFVSFHADILGRALKAIQHPRHQLLLLYPEAGDLIEATSDGARINWVRDDYRLSQEEQGRILHREPIRGTGWEVADLHNADLFRDYRASLFLQSAAVFAVFLLLTLVMLLYLRREEGLRRAAERQIERMAYYDEMTGLPNRRLVRERLRQAMAHSGRHGGFGALMFMDLDNFKSLNDVHGHDMGDQLLVEAGRRLRTCVRAEDTVARFGGDEFVVLLEGLDPTYVGGVEKSQRVGQKLLSALSEPYRLSAPAGGEWVEHRCTSSIGIVLFQGDESCLEDLLKWADLAMYSAKSSGRNQLRVSEEGRVAAVARS